MFLPQGGRSSAAGWGPQNGKGGALSPPRGPLGCWGSKTGCKRLRSCSTCVGLERGPGVRQCCSQCCVIPSFLQGLSHGTLPSQTVPGAPQQCPVTPAVPSVSQHTWCTSAVTGPCQQAQCTAACPVHIPRQLPGSCSHTQLHFPPQHPAGAPCDSKCVCLRLLENISAYNCRICSCAAVCLGVRLCVSVCTLWGVCVSVWGVGVQGEGLPPALAAGSSVTPALRPSPLSSAGATAAPAGSSPSWCHLAVAPWRPSSRCATSCGRHRRTSAHPPPLPLPATWAAARPLPTAWRR